RCKGQPSNIETGFSPPVFAPGMALVCSIMKCSMTLVILLLDAFLGSSTSRLSLSAFALMATSSTSLRKYMEALLPRAEVLRSMAYSTTSVIAGVATMAPKRSPEPARFLVVDKEDTTRIFDNKFSLLNTYREIERHLGNNSSSIFTLSV